MINLLPAKNKKAVKNEILRRTIVVAGLAVLVLLFVQLVFSFISLLAINSFREDLQEQVSAIGQLAKKENLDELEKQADQLNNMLASFKDNQNEARSVSLYLGEILKILPTGVRIYSFTFEKTKGGAVQINLRGDALLREYLISFVGALEASSKVEKVVLPPSNLLSKTNVDFNLSFRWKDN